MADLTLTPKDYNYLLAMINHEAGNTISNSLKKGDTNDAFGQIVGLAETWMNRAAAKGASMESVMYHPQLSHFPTQSAPDYSLIQSKANSLDPAIKAMFDGYLYNRSQGEDGLLGKVNQYLNRDVTDALYSQKYRDWYDKSDLVGAYGDKRSGGKTSLQQEFLHNSQMTIPDYTLKVSPEIRLNPSEAAVDNFAAFQNSYQPPPRAVANAPLPPPRPDEFRGDGFVGPINDFSDAITSGLENAGNAALGGLNAIGDTLSGMFRPSNQNAGPAPGPYDFAQYGSPGGIGDPNFGAGIAPAPLPSLTPAPTLDAPAGSNTIANLFQSILGRPADAPTLQAFDAELDSGRMDLNAIQAALRGSEEAKTLGPMGEAKTYSPLETIFARQFDRAPDAGAIQNWGSVNGSDIGALEAQLYGSQEAQTYRAGLGDLASLISPGTAPTIGAGPTAPTIPPALTSPLAPTPNQSITATPGIGNYDFASNYLTANADVAAAGMNPWEHFLRYGAQEGRALNTAGDKFDASRYLSENADVQQAGQDALTHYLSYGAAEGRDAPIIGANGTTRDIGSLGLTPTITASLMPYLQPQSFAQTIGANTAPTIGPQQSEFTGSFDAGEYLRANADVAQAGMDPLQHFLRYGFAEGRAINPGGAHINQGFDPSAYLQQNPDVAAAKLDPLAHFLLNGASEGRAAPTGSNPYSFSNFNVAQGLGPVGPGAFGLSGVTGGMASTIPSFGTQNVSQGVPNGSFGAGIMPTPQISPYGFSGLNPSGFLGATSQGLGSSYAVGSAADLGFGSSGGGGGSGGDGTIDPYGFGGDVSGFDVNSLGGSATQESPVAGGYGDGVAIQGRNNQASQNAFIAGEWKKAADSTAAARLLGEQITNVAPGNQTNYALGAINTPIAPIQHTQFTPVNMSGVFAPLPTAAFMPRFTF